MLVVADESADPEMVAADLLAQAEHDVEVTPFLVTAHASVIDAGSPHPPGCLDMSTLKLASIGNWQSDPCYAIRPRKCPNDSFVKQSAQYWLEVFEMVPPPWRQIQLSGGRRCTLHVFGGAAEDPALYGGIPNGSSLLRQESRRAMSDLKMFKTDNHCEPFCPVRFETDDGLCHGF